MFIFISEEKDEAERETKSTKKNQGISPTMRILQFIGAGIGTIMLFYLNNKWCLRKSAEKKRKKDN